MIPQATEFDFTEQSAQPSRTYRIDFDKGRAAGYADGIEAVKQAIILVLNTDRFRHLIFSWNYGSELKSVMGTEKDLAQSEIKRLVSEALLQDDRITAVDSFEFSYPLNDTIAVRFAVTTVFGKLEHSTEVTI